MTTDANRLRNSVVEAMAQAIDIVDADMLGTDPTSDWFVRQAEAALDAALDVLGAKVEGDGWIEYAHTIPQLLRLLRDSGKGDS